MDASGSSNQTDCLDAYPGFLQTSKTESFAISISGDFQGDNAWTHLYRVINCQELL